MSTDGGTTFIMEICTGSHEGLCSASSLHYSPHVLRPAGGLDPFLMLLVWDVYFLSQKIGPLTHLQSRKTLLNSRIGPAGPTNWFHTLFFVMT